MNTIRFGATNSLSRDVTGQTAGQVLDNPGIRGALGFTGSVVAKINGVAVDRNYTIRAGEVIDIENQAQQKAAAVTITVAFGATASLTRTVPDHTRVADVLNDASIRAALGFGSGAIARIQGAEVRSDLLVTNGMRIDIETRAQQKAARR